MSTRNRSARTRWGAAAVGVVLASAAILGSAGAANAVMSTASPVAAALPAFTSAPVPTISGTAKVGSKLTAVVSVWKPTRATTSYQWRRSGVAIAGATSAGYTVLAADAGMRITVSVTGKKSGYQTLTKTSVQTAVIARPVKVLTAAPIPKLVGVAAQGVTLAANSGTWAPSPVALTYSWQRNGAAISGATGSRYKLTAADVGSQITVTVAGAKSGYASASKRSAASARILAPTSYANCTALNVVFPHGVARSGARDLVGASGTAVTTFAVSDSVYAMNTKSDRDKDGVACEKK